MQSRSGKAVFGVNAAVSMALVVLVAAVALVVNPPSPPGISAFAPQASKPIVKAPPGQSSSSGLGAGACAVGQVCTGPSATPRPTTSATTKPGASAAPTTAASAAPIIAGVPSALQCYSWPDGSVTQTFDPQSPPCVATWPGQAQGNGGSTSQGVTSTEIKVAVPVASSGSNLAGIQVLADFFNTHFELYGRKIVLVPYNSAQLATTNYNDPSSQHADGEETGSLKAFASLDFLDGAAPDAALPTWFGALQQEHVIALSGGAFAPITSQSALTKAAPYAWSFKPTVDTLLEQAGIQACQQLVGKKAIHSSTYANDTRKFAIIVPDSSLYGGPVPGIDKLVSTLTGCGANKPTVIYFTGTADSVGTTSADFTKLKAQGVTTIIQLLSAPVAKVPAMNTANDVGYTPEWDLLVNNNLEAVNVSTSPNSEQQNSFGVIASNKLNPLEEAPWRNSYLDAGGDQNGVPHFIAGEGAYQELLMLASGIQTAGPHLTPQTFSAGLTSTVFPNPGAAGAPTYQATVGFPFAGATMTRDFVGWWIAPGQNEASTIKTGLAQAGDDWQELCWVSLGVRYVDSSWPTTDSIRQGACR